MPSPVRGGERGSRESAEGILRALGLGAVALALILAALARPARPRMRVVGPSSLSAVLARPLPRGDTLAVVTDTALDPVHRDWLAAVRASDNEVRWEGAIPPLALAVEPLADPAGSERVLAAAAQGNAVEVSDSAGRIDSATAASGGAALVVPRLVGSATARLGEQRARASSGDSLLLRRLVVFGIPSWETKFVIAALEERGWLVDARIPLSSDTALVQGLPARLDTARVAAVVALDRAALPHAARIAGFVRRGGGLVLGSEAASADRFGSLRAGNPGARQSPAMLEIAAEEPRRGLGFSPIGRLAPGAVVLERRNGAVTVAARRVGAGRVVQVGYDDSWRWRMAGPDGSVEAHRQWWSSLAGSAAYRPTVASSRGVSSSDAPLARMAAALGPMDPAIRGVAEGQGQPGSGDRPPGWLFLLGLGALLFEWASRRLRGAP